MNSADLKYLIRSGSFKFMKDRTNKSHSLESYYYMGKPVYYRTSTSDMMIIHEILLKKDYKAEYWLPKEIEPEVILDIGGNIGITSIYLTNRFPNAKIFTFEPVPQNFEILKKNTEQYKNIKIFNVGLGSQDGSFDIFMSEDSDNFGGASLYIEAGGVNTDTKVTCQIRNANDILAEIGVSNIDLLKIDTEGAEYDILMSIDKELLKQVKWITGELHGYKDFELLNYLESLDFSIGMKKALDNRLFMFHCAKQNVIDKLSKKDKKNLIK
ncbi:MAG: FkbM family methyltransferase [Arcobacteraceae bacterium]|nr:FkbM family methyltransferase [Arcobacteraceae bacterium]